MSKYFDLLQEGERDEAPQRRQSAVPQLPAGDDLFELDLPFLPDTRALATNPRAVRLAPIPKRQLTVRSVVEGCFRYPGRFLIAAGVVSLLTVMAVLWVPRQYPASMQLEALSANSYAAASMGVDEAAGAAGASEVNLQASLLRSRDLLGQALDGIGEGAVVPAAREKAIDDLARRIKVAASPASSSVQVSVTDSSPEKATFLLQTLASVFVARELELLQPPHERLGLNAEQSQRKLVEAQRDLARFKEQTGIGSTADYEAAVMRQLEGYAADSTNLANKLAEVRQRRVTPLQETLTGRLAALESKRNRLLDSYPVNDPIVLNVDGQITRLRDRLVRGDADPSTLEGRTELAERNSVEAQKRGYVAQLDRLQAQSAEFARLQKQLTEAQRNFEISTAKRDQVAGADAGDRERMLAAVLLAKPSGSLRPLRPRPGVYLAIGLSAALLLAVMVCTFTELKRSTVCSAAELDALTGVPTLGTLAWQRAERSGPLRRKTSRLPGEPR